MFKHIHRLIFRLSSIKDKIKKERQERLAKAEESLPTKTNPQLERIRNIAIIAHIDAGKTTTTERMLYYAGALNVPGEVDEGTTTMDYLPQQRARGITIRSAAISFNWKNHQINVIDTPGHVDFSGEVARSVRVLDGVVTVFDAVHGVQTQTEKVWAQANKRKLAKICFVNKMDRVGASVDHTVKTIKERMAAQSLVLQYPIGESESFRGVVDLINMKSIIFEGKIGEYQKVSDLNPKDIYYSRYMAAREQLIEKVIQYDEQIADLYLNNAVIKPQKLQASIRKIINNPRYIAQVCAVLIGSAFKNKGIQPLLDGILNYLPSPSEREPVTCSQNSQLTRKPLKNQKLCVYVFKIIYDKEKGPMFYARVYSGTLNKNSILLNSTKNTFEKIQFLYRVRADNYVLVNEVFAGDIVAISGLKGTSAGDTLITSQDQKFILEELKLPTPIFMAPFQVATIKDQSALESRLAILVQEDNSLLMKKEQDTGQLVLSGLGELHLEIVRDRLIEEGIQAKMGKLKIGYRETLQNTVKKTLRLKKSFNKVDYEFELQVEIIPIKNEDEYIEANDVLMSFKKDSADFDKYWEQYLKRKNIIKRAKSNDLQDVEQVPVADKSMGRYIRNPCKQIPIQQDKPEQYEQNQEEEEQQSTEEQSIAKWYHICTLPFQYLDTLVESIKLSLLSGRYRFPLISLEVHLINGRYQAQKLNKAIVSNCASNIIKDIIAENSVLVEPVVSVELIGEQSMLQYAAKDIIKKRGRIENRQNRKIFAKVPAEGIRGWVKSLRAMGFDTDIKFSGYEQVQGIDPQVLVDNDNQ